MLNAWKNIGNIWWNCWESESEIIIQKHYHQKSLQAYTEIFNRLPKSTNLIGGNNPNFANPIPLLPKEDILHHTANHLIPK